MVRLGSKSFNEIMNQEKAWETVLSDRDYYQEIVTKLKSENFDRVIFVGCGSSYYISLSGSFVFTKLTGIESQAVPASELIFYPEVYLNSAKKILVFAVSRSGKTTEVIKAIETISGNYNIATVGLTCYEDSQLAQICDYVLFSRDGKEESVVMTKSFTSLLLSIQLVAGLWASDQVYLNQLTQLADQFRSTIDLWWSRIETFVNQNGFSKHEFLGQGNLFGLTNEAMLKMKEMSIVPSEDFHSLEFRHGPKSIADADMLVTMFIGDRTFESEKKLAQELLGYNATLIIICNQADEEIKRMNQLVLELNTELSQYVLTPLYLVPCQLLAYYTAVKKGIDVDNPRNLTHVVENI